MRRALPGSSGARERRPADPPIHQHPEREFLLFDGPGGATGIGFLLLLALGHIFARKREKKKVFFFAFLGGVFALFGGDSALLLGVISRFLGVFAPLCDH